MEKQKTISKQVSIEGIGLHTGNKSRVIFKPAPENFGIKFVRIDLQDKPVINAIIRYVSGTAVRGTTIANGTGQVHTIEHILAVCSGLGIDNLEILINNNEPPIMDGSAKPFADILIKAGIEEQNEEKNYFVVNQPVTYQSDKTTFIAYPSNDFSLDCKVNYDHPLIKEQQISLKIDAETFLEELAPARTFCFDYEIEALRSKGLAKGGNLSNAIVVGLKDIHNPEPLRFKNEFVRHKALDLLGDLFLIGRPIKAHIVAVRSGHNHNVSFTKELAKVGGLFVD
ncbi:MAG: UDP-3-O-acyl-N-acetylglucosamine deacetylase [Elusimicrobia bacterium]|nr:UDP-3-O-acyl-N-acetylglucosamine deacetylase [Elusimicrobiota bacterium]